MIHDVSIRKMKRNVLYSEPYTDLQDTYKPFKSKKVKSIVCLKVEESWPT